MPVTHLLPASSAASTRLVRWSSHHPVAKRKTLFDDRPVEISELTYIIKRNIASLNSKIANLQKLASNGGGSSGRGKQAEEHNNNVLVMLQGALANTSMGFKDVLEIRTQNMKASKSRTEQFGYTNQNATASAPPSGEHSSRAAPNALLFISTACKIPFLLIHSSSACSSFAIISINRFSSLPKRRLFLLTQRHVLTPRVRSVATTTR